MPITPTDVDPGDDTIGMYKTGYFAEAERQKKERYTNLENRIFDKVMRELTFPSARKDKELDVKSLAAYLEEGGIHPSQNQVKETLRLHIRHRIEDSILEGAGYARPRQKDPYKLAEFLENTFSWLKFPESHNEGVSKLDAIAAEEIKAFRASAVGKTA